MKRVKFTLVELLVVILIGCVLVALMLPASQEAREAAWRAQENVSGEGAPAAAPPPQEGVAADRYQVAPQRASGVSDGLPGAGSTTTAPGVDRKIIYQANIDLVVEDFAGVPEKVVDLVKKFGGYVADSTLSGSAGDSRHGTWKVRVPVERFEEFVNSAKGLGELVSVGTTSQDVSEEYYDVDARIRNKTKEEERLVKLLEERPGKLEDVIAIERELSRVREELERMQGRMRVIADLTSMTTVQITINEIRNYEPPETAGLATRIRRAFEGSLTALQTAGESTLVAAVAALPWFAVLAVVLTVVFVPARRITRRGRAALETKAS